MIDQRKPRTREDCEAIIEDGIATAMHATRTAAHSQLEYCSPGSIAFGRDMVLNIPFEVDLILLKEKRQLKIDDRLIRDNVRRSHVDYQPGMNVYVLTSRKSKLDKVYDGPFPIVATHTNGTVTVQLSPYVTDRVNIRRLKPDD